MRTTQLCPVIVIFGTLSAAHAQTSPSARRPPVELGVGVDATWLRAGLFLDGGIVTEPLVHIRLTQPITPEFGIEAVFGVSRWFKTDAFDYRTEALYSFQAKHYFWRSGRSGFFATYGAAGSWTRSLVYSKLMPPFYLIAGAGFQREFSRRAAVRFEAQGVMFAGFAPMGARLSTGLSFPFGRYD